MSSIAASSANAASSPIAASSVAPGTPRALGRGRFARVGLATTVAAVLANVLVYFAGDALVRYDPRFLPLTNVSGAVLFTLAPAIVAVGLYGVLLRRAVNPARVFTKVSAVVFVLTLIPDFTYIPGQPGATGAQTAILVLMHAVAAIVIVGMLTTLARPRTR